MRYTTLPSLALALVTGLAFPLQTLHAQDCTITYTVLTGCNADGTGWATMTNVQGDGGFHNVHWNGSESAGGNTLTPIPNGPNSVTVFDITGCDLTQSFTIDCPPPTNGNDCQFRTQTQGGWGSNPNGNNPGTYLAANFAAAFPNGLTIGCTNQMRLTSAAAVRAFLPSGSTARALPAGTITNPGNSYRNVLAGQLVALTLSLGFDAHDANFGSSSNSLANAVFQSGPFQGWRVFELVDEANRFIGGCSSTYTASQLNSALSMVNENYVDGSTNNGNLACGLSEAPRTVARTSNLDVRLLALPVQTTLDLVVITEVDGPVTVEMRDATGRITGQRRTFNAQAGTETRISMDVTALHTGTYFVMCQQGQQRNTKRFPVAR